MTVSDGTYVQVSVRSIANASTIMNVWYLKTRFTGSMADVDFMDAVATIVSDHYGYLNNYLSEQIVPTDIKFDEVVYNPIKFRPDISRYIGTVAWDTGYAPVAAGDSLPEQDALLVKFRTSGIKTLGRKYIGILAESDRNGGGWVSGFVSAIGTFITAWLGEQAVDTDKFIQWGVFAKRAAQFLFFLSAAFDTRARTQRRRVEGVGV